MSSIVVVTQHVHPAPRSAEGIVTGALVDALHRGGHDVSVVSSTSHEPLDGGAPLAASQRQPVAPARGLQAWRHLPARSGRGALARAVDRSGALAGRAPFSVASWATPAAGALLDRLEVLPAETVVWARGLPEASLAAALRARRRRSFPLVCSLGDPLPPERRPWSGTDARVARLARRQVRALGRLADAWTFPSRAVADQVAAAGELDTSRCFVLPHLLADPRSEPAPSDTTVDGAPVVAYAGSAYRWLVEGSLLRALGRAEQAGRLRLVLVLRDADGAAVAAARRGAPAATVHQDLPPRSAAALVAASDAVLVPGPRADLLYTKVVEALRHAQPVLSVSPLAGTTARLVRQAGGVLVPPDADDRRLDQAVDELLATLHDPARRHARSEVAARLAPEVVVHRAERVLAFASARHRAQQAHHHLPEPPAIDRWP